MSAPLPLPPDPLAEARRPGTSYALVLRFTPEANRDVLAFLFVLKLTLDRLLEAGSEPGVMRAKALWWEEELGRATRGGSRHPLTLRAQSLGLLSARGTEDLPRFAAGYVPLVGTSQVTAEDLLARAEASGGELLERVARALGECGPEEREGARLAGTAHEAVALLLHDRGTRERFPEGDEGRRALLARIRADLDALPERLGRSWTGGGQRATRILVALTRARLLHGEPGPLRKIFLAWWHARHEHDD